MHILNDFFLLSWQEDARVIFTTPSNISSFLDTSYQNDEKSFLDFASITLICDYQNIDKFSQLQMPKTALTKLSGVEEFDKQRVQYLQKELLLFLSSKKDMKLNKQIEQRFDKLRKEGIIGYERARMLISLLALIEKKEEVKTKKIEIKTKSENFYKNSISTILQIIEYTKEILESKTDKERLDKIPQKIKNQEFSIGVTGVMNAGKSTMLNALLKENILGTSVVPETANLTLLKYSKNKEARVNFWKKAEWKKIESDAIEIDSLAKFVEETKKSFKDDMSKYITDSGYSIKIDSSELVNFTSAKHSQKKCNLVKSVELFSDLEFLKDGVVIVDTPGLDDPVIQREEITKTYLNQCDLMMHLMNVNQSATQKDVEFICDTLLYQNVSRLLIIITRIDTVTQDELEEVITYTKQSIQQRLSDLNKQSSFNSIIDKLDFIPIAAKVALDLRLQNKTKIDGYDLSKSGILDVEEYLSEVLFGKESQKAKIIISSTCKEIFSTLLQNQKRLNKELEFLDKDANSLKSELQTYEENIKKSMLYIEKLDSKIQDETQNLQNYFKTLKNLAKNRILQLQSIIKRRVIDDVSYEKRKNKKRPTKQRIEYFIDTGIKDGFIELLREYRYSFEKKMNEVFENLQREFEYFNDEKSFETDSKEFFQRYFSDASFSSSNAFITKKVNENISLHVKKDLQVLDSIIDEIFNPYFEDIYTKFIEKTSLINENLLSNFKEQANSSVQSIKEDVKEKQNLLETTKQRMQDSTFDIQNRVDEIKTKLEAIKKLEASVSELRSECE